MAGFTFDWNSFLRVLQRGASGRMGRAPAQRETEITIRTTEATRNRPGLKTPSMWSAGTKL